MRSRRPVVLCDLLLSGREKSIDSAQTWRTTTLLFREEDINIGVTLTTGIAQSSRETEKEGIYSCVRKESGRRLRGPDDLRAVSFALSEIFFVCVYYFRGLNMYIMDRKVDKSAGLYVLSVENCVVVYNSFLKSIDFKPVLMDNILYRVIFV